MGRALLVYTAKDISSSKVNSVTLESGSLRYIDSCTKEFESEKALVNSYVYRQKTRQIENGYLRVYNIRNNAYKERIPILLNDCVPIYLNDNYFDKITSEIEKSRKLLFRSKNKMFMKKFLATGMFDSTTKFNIKLTNAEYKFALKKELPILNKDGEYFVNANELFKFSLKEEKLGILKPVFEEVLDVWKKEIKKLGDEAVYYYSRNLRILLNDYYKKIRSNKMISNLKIRKKLTEVLLYNYNNQKEVEVVRSKITAKTKLKDKIV